MGRAAVVMVASLGVNQVSAAARGEGRAEGLLLVGVQSTTNIITVPFRCPYCLCGSNCSTDGNTSSCCKVLSAVFCTEISLEYRDKFGVLVELGEWYQNFVWKVGTQDVVDLRRCTAWRLPISSPASPSLSPLLNASTRRIESC